MANLDTALKRASGVHVGMPWRMPGKYPPSGTFGATGRAAAAFMYGGIAVGVVVGGGGFWYPDTKRRTKEELRDERIALGILQPAVVEALPVAVKVKARRLGTISVDQLLGRAKVDSMSALDLEFAVQRAKRKKRQREEDELLLMY